VGAAELQSAGATTVEERGQGDPGQAPKKQRKVVNLNVFKVNPLDRGDNDQAGANAADDDGPRHRLGLGKTPVRDLVNRVLGGGDRDDDTDTESEAAAG
jgi:hypothetical protein